MLMQLPLLSSHIVWLLIKVSMIYLSNRLSIARILSIQAMIIPETEVAMATSHFSTASTIQFRRKAHIIMLANMEIVKPTIHMGRSRQKEFTM
jgi:hypothetical protein